MAGDWDAKVASFAAARDGKPLPATETLRSGDRLEIVLAPPDEPESLMLTFFTLDRTGRKPVRKVFEFDDMPIKFTKDRGKNLWRAAFDVPRTEKAADLKKGDFSFDVTRYGADTHFDGQTTIAVPFAVSFAEGAGSVRKSALRLYDFGPNDAAVYRGAEAVSPASTPEGFKWLAGPNRWEKANFGVLDPLMHDWAGRDGGMAPMRFRLDLPAGKWKAAAGFGGFGQLCWRNGDYQPASFVFSVDGQTVCTRISDERKRFAYRAHEADPDEDIYATYIRPIIPERRFDIVTDGKGVEFSLVCTNVGKKAVIDYLAVWPADDAAAEEQYDAILERRRARFNSIVQEDPAVDHYSFISRDRYAKERERIAADVPFLAALENPYDWVVPTLAPPSAEPVVTVKAARGEKTCGAFVFRSDRDEASVTASVRGFPDWAHAKVYKVMNYRFIRGGNHHHYIAPNHLMPGPRKVRKGLNYMWYVRVDIADDAPAGTWRGEVELQCGDRCRRIPAELTVYDVTLPKLDDYRIGLMGAGDGTREQMLFAKNELGATTVHLSNGRLNGAKLKRDASGKIIGCENIGWCTVEDLDRRFKTYAEVGFPCKVPYCGPSIIDRHDAYPIEGMKPFSPEWTEGLKVVLRTILAVARSNGCESVSMDLGGELGHDAHRPDPDAVKAVVRFLKLAKELEPGIEYTWRCNCMDSTTNFYPLLDYACIRGNSWKWVDRESDFGKKKRIGVYSQGGRFMNGVSAWYHGAKGSFREWVSWSHALEFNEFLCQGACGCAGHIESMVGPKAEGGYTLSQRGEAWRAGIDDIRYLKLLENALAAAPDGAAKTQAQAFLAYLHDAVRNSWAFCGFCAFGGPGRQDGGNDWPYLRQDVMRDLCVRLTAALSANAAADLPGFPVLPEVDRRTFLAFDDGPLDYAHKRRIGGQVLIPKDFRSEKPVLTLSGEGLAARTLELKPRGVRTRQLYYMPSGRSMEFAIDGADLGPGNYELTLRIGETLVQTIPLTLVEK